MATSWTNQGWDGQLKLKIDQDYKINLTLQLTCLATQNKIQLSWKLVRCSSLCLQTTLASSSPQLLPSRMPTRAGPAEPVYELRVQTDSFLLQKKKNEIPSNTYCCLSDGPNTEDPNILPETQRHTHILFSPYATQTLLKLLFQ